MASAALTWGVSYVCFSSDLEPIRTSHCRVGSHELRTVSEDGASGKSMNSNLLNIDVIYMSLVVTAVQGNVECVLRGVLDCSWSVGSASRARALRRC